MMMKLTVPDSVSGLVYVRMKSGVVGGVQAEEYVGKNNPLQTAIETMRTLSAKYQPYTPFEYEFLNREYNDMYFGEQVEGKLSTFFASVALFICCLGLLGLATYTAERRTKEIGVRKVLGASIQDIIILLSKDFMILVAIAFVVGSPIAYYFVNKWLEDFKYRIEFNAGIFMFAGVCAVVIAFLSVAWQSWKAATVNPVQSIKTE
jgi:putative ABC transport system permease protein